MLHIFSDVAKAVARLHHRIKPIIHRDLKVCTIELFITDTFREQHFGCMYTKTIYLGPHSLQLTFLQMRSLRVASLCVCVRKHFTSYIIIIYCTKHPF